MVLEKVKTQQQQTKSVV